MSCVSALHTQLVTLLSVPHEILLFRHKVFKEYVKIAVGPDFIHTLPSFIVLAAMIIILWRCPPKMDCINFLVNKPSIFRTLQVLASWITANGVLWLWLIFQRILYCFVWSYWSYESEYRETTVIPWWQRVWSSYYPPPLQPPIFSAGFISWIMSMIVSIGIFGYATSSDKIQNIFSEVVPAGRDFLNIAQYYLSWSTSRFRELMSCDQVVTVDGSEISSICDDCRSDVSSADVTHEGITRREVHPISYGTNWTPRPSFSGYNKESNRKYHQPKQIRSPVTVTGGSTIHHDNDDVGKLSPTQLRHRRGCHTVVPSNSSDKSSGC